MRWAWLWVIGACTGDEPAGPGLDHNFGVTEDLGVPDCDNLVEGAYCAVPFPSDVWFDEAAGRLALSAAALPRTAAGRTLDLTRFDQDGFGVASPLLFELPGATLQGMPAVFDPGPSLLPDARTVVVNADTGERIPHWVETDWLERTETPSLLVIRPAVPLPAGAHVVVGVRGMVGADGQPVAPPEAFRALRDAEASRWIGVHARRARYEDRIFPALEAAGVPRDELQLAWDLTVRGEEGATTDLRTVADRVLAAVGAAGPAWRIDAVTLPEGDPTIAVIVDGVAEVPSFVLPPEGGVRRLRRDADGLPVADGVEQVPFRLQIPHRVREAAAPSPVLQYGHGFLGTRDEANNGWLREMAQRHGFSILAVDMQGMSTANAAAWGVVIASDAGRMVDLADEPMQGIANHLALQRWVVGGLQGEVPAELQRLDGGPAFDPARVWYHGNSQGGTMGNVLLAVSRDVTRGALGVPGCCFPYLLQRSAIFDAWADALSGIYDAPEAIPMVLALLGTGWDRLEGMTWAPYVVDPLPGLPAHQALLHLGLEDAQVQNDASWLLARSMAAVQPPDHPRPVWGVPEQAWPITAPAVVVNWDYGVPPDPTPLDPPNPDTDTHGRPRADPVAQDQVVHFLRTGEVLCPGCAP